MSVKIEDKLSKEIDDYLEYWKKSIDELSGVYPKENRSQDLNTVIDYLQSTLNLYERGSNQVFIKLTINTNRFTNKMMRNNAREKTEEKMFLDRAFQEDRCENAAKLLRLLHMIEYELPVIHYSLMMKNMTCLLLAG